jgi:hypothetical protein
LTVAAVWTFGARDGAIMLPHLLSLVALLLLATHVERRLAPEAVLPLGAILLACIPVVYQSAIQCYPNVLFAALFLSFLYLVHRVARMARIPPSNLALMGILAGLSQLTRTDFVLGLVPVAVYLIAVRGSHGAAKPIGALLLGWALLDSLEWFYTVSHYGAVSPAARSATIWTNLANVKYGSTWLYYVHIDRKEILLGYWRQHLASIAQNAPRLLEQLVMVSLHQFGRASAVAGILAILGVLHLWRVGRREFFGLIAIMMSWIVAYAFLRPGVRYLIWMLVIVGICIRLGWQIAIKRLGLWRGWSETRRAWIGELGVVAMVLVILRGAPWQAAMHTTRFYTREPTTYYAPQEDDSRMRWSMERSLLVNYPTLRQVVPDNAIIATTEPAMHWYADRLALYLPLDRQSFDAIEREWFPIDFIYLGPTIFFDRPQPIDERYRRFLTLGDGSIADSPEGKLDAFIQHFPEYVPIQEFDNGGVLLARKPVSNSR